MHITLVDLAIAILATWHMVEIWNHSYIMAASRARASLMDNLLGRLLGCPFCLSVWVAWFVVIITVIPTPGISDNPASWLLFGLVGGVKLAVIGFAVARGANLGNDLAYLSCRTPRVDQIAGDPLDIKPDANSDDIDDDNFNELLPLDTPIARIYNGEEKPDV